MSREVIIIGGGISGLSLAWFLRAKNKSVLLLEQSSRVGGSIRTETRDGFLLERGPNTTALSNMPLYELINGVGLESQLEFPPPSAKKRFILKRGELMPLPMGVGSLFSTKIFSASGKLRVLREPFIAKGKNHDETVADFFARRLGNEIAEYAVKPFISGIYAGDAEQLAVRASFPSMFDVEQEFGSLLTGFIKRSRKQRRDGTKPIKPPNSGKSFTFPDGLETLTHALQEKLRDVIVTDAANICIEEQSSSTQISWQQDNKSFIEDATTVVLAAPSYAAAELVNNLDKKLSGALETIQYAPIAIVHLGFRREDVGRALDGFGFLVPPCENKQILGCIFSSSLYAKRAPDGNILLTVFLGGSRKPELLARTDEELFSTAIRELTPLLNIHGTPTLRLASRIPRAIPQYTIAYTRVMEIVDAFELQHPNIKFCNNFKGGISIGDCVKSAAVVAERICEG